MNLERLMALAQGKKKELAARSNFNNLIKPPEGKSRWRILPGWRDGDAETYSHEFGQHYIKDADGNTLAVFVCEARTFGTIENPRECPICNTISDHIRSGKDDDTTLEKIKEMKVRSVFLVNAVRLDGADADPKKPVLLALPGSAFGSFNDILVEYGSTHGINVLDEKEGRNITIDRTGKGPTNTKYQVMIDPVNSAVNREALSKLIDIDAFIESERVKGLQRGLDQIEKGVASIRGLTFTPGVKTELPRLVRPAAASRVIESDVVVIDDDVVLAERNMTTAVKETVRAPAPAPESSPKETPVKEAPVTIAPKPLEEDELFSPAALDKLLASLND